MASHYGNYGAPPPSQGGYGGNVGYGQGGGGGGYGQPPPSYGPPSGGGYSQAPAPYESNTQYGQPQGPPSYNRSAPPAGGGYGGPPPSYGGESGGYGGGSSGGYSNGSSRGGGRDYDSGPRGNSGGFNKALPSGGGGRDGSDFVVQEDTIFVSGMNPDTNEHDIQQHFGAIGIIKMDKRTMKPKIWLYIDKSTGRSKGEATVTFDDAHAAGSAITWFDGKDFNGSVIKVQLATKKDNWSQGRGGGRGGFGGGRGGGGFGRGGGGPPRGGDREERGGGGRDREERGGGGYSRGGRDGGGRGRDGGEFNINPVLEVVAEEEEVVVEVVVGTVTGSVRPQTAATRTSLGGKHVIDVMQSGPMVLAMAALGAAEAVMEVIDAVEGTREEEGGEVLAEVVEVDEADLEVEIAAEVAPCEIGMVAEIGTAGVVPTKHPTILHCVQILILPPIAHLIP